MYIMGTDMYECDFCGFQSKFDENDDVHGNMWECEDCGKIFCEKCFIDRWGRKAWDKVLRDGMIGSFETDRIMCPECYGEIIKDYPEKEEQ